MKTAATEAIKKKPLESFYIRRRCAVKKTEDRPPQPSVSKLRTSVSRNGAFLNEGF